MPRLGFGMDAVWVKSPPLVHIDSDSLGIANSQSEYENDNHCAVVSTSDSHCSLYTSLM